MTWWARTIPRGRVAHAFHRLSSTRVALRFHCGAKAKRLEVATDTLPRCSECSRWLQYLEDVDAQLAVADDAHIFQPDE